MYKRSAIVMLVIIIFIGVNIIYYNPSYFDSKDDVTEILYENFEEMEDVLAAEGEVVFERINISQKRDALFICEEKDSEYFYMMPILLKETGGVLVLEPYPTKFGIPEGRLDMILFPIDERREVVMEIGKNCNSTKESLVNHGIINYRYHIKAE